MIMITLSRGFPNAVEIGTDMCLYTACKVANVTPSTNPRGSCRVCFMPPWVVDWWVIPSSKVCIGLQSLLNGPPHIIELVSGKIVSEEI